MKFLASGRDVPIPALSEAVFAFAKMLFGLSLFLVVAPMFRQQSMLFGWISGR